MIISFYSKVNGDVMRENKLRYLRECREMSQKELCEELKKTGCYITRSTYSKYETGSHNISCEVLVKLALFFETSTDYILNYK